MNGDLRALSAVNGGLCAGVAAVATADEARQRKRRVERSTPEVEALVDPCHVCLDERSVRYAIERDQRRLAEVKTMRVHPQPIARRGLGIGLEGVGHGTPRARGQPSVLIVSERVHAFRKRAAVPAPVAHGRQRKRIMIALVEALETCHVGAEGKLPIADSKHCRVVRRCAYGRVPCGDGRAVDGHNYSRVGGSLLDISIIILVYNHIRNHAGCFRLNIIIMFVVNRNVFLCTVPMMTEKNVREMCSYCLFCSAQLFSNRIRNERADLSTLHKRVCDL